MHLLTLRFKYHFATRSPAEERQKVEEQCGNSKWVSKIEVLSPPIVSQVGNYYSSPSD